MSGWIKMHRKVLDSTYGRNLEIIGFWASILMMCNHKEGFTHDGTRILPGQFMTSQMELAKKFKISRGKVQRLLKKLEFEHQIEQRSNFQNTIITVINWDKYQSADQQDEQRPSSDRAPTEQRPSTNKNAKNVKNAKKGKAKESFCSPLNELFESSPEIQKWLNTGSKNIHEDILAKYEIEFVRNEIIKAFTWTQENKARQAGLYLKSWFENAKNPIFKSGLTPREEALQNLFETYKGMAG